MAETNTKAELREVATTLDGRDITRGYVDPMRLLLPQDTVLMTRGGGNYDLYREVLRDDQVKTCFQQRVLAVTSREWEVEPGGSMRVDKKAAEFLKEQLQHIGWDSATEKMLYGVFYGHAVSECLYARDGNHVVLDQVKVRDRRRFGFDGAGRLRLLTFGQPEGELLPDRKFWAFQTGADHDDEPYGLGLGHWLYWPTFFKRNGMKFWLIFLEKFGQPTATGKYPNNAGATEKTRLLQALRAIHTDSGIIVPEGMVIELLEAARSGTADYTALYDRMNAAISKVIVGQTMTADDGSSRAQASVHMDVRQDIVKADADLICDSFNRGPAHWLTGWNFTGAATPRVWRRLEEPEDLRLVATRDKTIFDMGFKPSLKYIGETYGGEWEEKAGPQPDPAAGAALPPGGKPKPDGAFAEHLKTCPHCAQFAEGDAPDALDGLRDLALDGWQPVMKPITHPLAAALDEALQAGETLEQFQARLPALLEQIDLSKLTKSLAQASFMARAAGEAGAEIDARKP